MFLAFLIFAEVIFSKKGKGVFLSGLCPPSIRASGGARCGLGFAKAIFWGKGFGKTSADFPPAERGLGNECGRNSFWIFLECLQKAELVVSSKYHMNQSAGYKIKCKNEDFQVTEVSLMLTLTSKKPHQFTYFWLQKSGLTTFDGLDHIKKFFKLKFDDVASQGLKDEDAITEQLISVKKILSEKDISAFNKKYAVGNKYFRIKHIVGYGKEPIKERMLHGNSFRIVIRNLRNGVANNLSAYLSTHRHHHFINYYDNQRFGMPGGPYNTHLIGEAIVKKDWKRAYDHIKMTNSIPLSIPRNTELLFGKLSGKVFNII